MWGVTLVQVMHCFLAGLQGDVSPSIYWVSGQVIYRHVLVFWSHHIGFKVPLCKEAQGKQKGHGYIFQLTLAAVRFSNDSHHWLRQLSHWGFRCFQPSALKSSRRGFNQQETKTRCPCYVLTSLKNLFYWRIVDLQGCVNFCYIAKWFSYTYILFHIFSIMVYYRILNVIPCAK